MQIFSNPNSELLREITARPRAESSEIEERVREIALSIKARGDAALREYSRAFDKVELKNWWVSAEEFERAEALVPPDLKKAIENARANIELFHRTQREEERTVETQSGVMCWRRSIPISPVGLYIPGGSAPLFSTALMAGVPAVIAGCKKIIACTPPLHDGTINPVILFTLSTLGIRTVAKLGGAHAIAALAFGTESIPNVQKIFGPGNQYVTAAKGFVSQHGVAIDMLAGPSEVAVIADESAQPRFVAADLLAQAEHGADSQVLLVTNSSTLLERVTAELESQCALLPRAEYARRALAASRAVLVDSITQGMEIVNAYAPEHLIIQCHDARSVSNLVENAGSVFIGHYSPEAVGDYASGTNHILPTDGSAARSAGVSLDSFLKKVTFQELSVEGLRGIKETVETMAHAEGLAAHARAVSIRFEGA
jgi:histidinol dehydrogenase